MPNEPRNAAAGKQPVPNSRKAALEDRIRKERAGAIIKRWREVAVLGIAGGIVWIAIERWTSPYIHRAFQPFLALPPLPGAIAFLILGFLAARTIKRSSWVGLIGLKFLGVYPPVWIAVAIGFVVVCVHAAYSGVWGPLLPWSTIAANICVPVCVLLLAGAIAFTLCGDSRAQKPLQARGRLEPPESPPGPDTTERELRRWASTDRPISQADEDRFGHLDIARRISRRLLSEGLPRPSTALVGKVGSGKSSICALIERELADQPFQVVVRVSLWPCESTEAAVRAVLDAIITGVDSHLPILSIAGLPDRYVAMLEHGATSLSWIGKYARQAADPQSIVDGLSQALVAANLRVILTIEDIERYVAPPASGKWTVARRERFNPIAALLYHLDQSPCVTVIVATTSLMYRADPWKVVRFIERIPTLSPRQVWPPLQATRGLWLSGSKEVIDPTHHRERNALQLPDPGLLQEAWFWEIRDENPSLQVSIAILIETARELKQVVAHTVELWDALAGEVDPDALLVVSVLRVTRPDVFSIVEEEVDAFRSGFAIRSMSDVKVLHRAHAKLKAELDREPTERNRSAIRAVLEYLFPDYSDHGSQTSDHYATRPQGLFVARHADYWARYLSGEKPDARTSDQAVLRVIARWKMGGQEIHQLLATTEGRSSVETFVSQFDGKALIRLLSETCHLLLPKQHPVRGESRHIDQIVSIWRMMLQIRPSSAALVDCMQMLIPKLVAANLPLADDVVYYISNRDGAVPHLVSEMEEEEIATLVVRNLLSSYREASPHAIYEAMRQGSPWSFYHLSWGWRRLRNNTLTGLPFSGWPRVAASLLQFAHEYPSVGVPVILTFITQGREQVIDSDDGAMTSRRNYEMVAEMAARLFAIDALVNLLRTASPVITDREMLSRWRAARDWAMARPSPN